jgi:hypothetical protein
MPSGPEHDGEDDRICIEGSRTLAGPALSEGVSRFIQAAVCLVYPDSAGCEPAPSHRRHHPSVPQPQGGGLLAVIGAGWPGHLVESGHIGSGHDAGGFGFASTAASVVKLAGSSALPVRGYRNPSTRAAPRLRSSSVRCPVSRAALSS